MLNRLCTLAATAAIMGTTTSLAQAPPRGASPPSPAQVAPAPASAPTQPPSASAQVTSAPAQGVQASAPDSLSVYFDTGSAALSPQGLGVLDKAARTYRDGKPIIMVVSGGSDSTGSAAANLRLSQQRAENVLQGLVARGIPVERFQLLAKGETEPAVPEPNGTAEPRNRRVEITWR
jgi:outer membrane protein OmpA-like peptidoglycan-associated protein